MCIQIWRDLTSLILSLPIQKHVYPSINSELLLLSSIKFYSILQRQREGEERGREAPCAMWSGLPRTSCREGAPSRQMPAWDLEWSKTPSPGPAPLTLQQARKQYSTGRWFHFENRRHRPTFVFLMQLFQEGSSETAAHLAYRCDPRGAILLRIKYML